MLNKQIAHELGVGETTIKAHVSEIMRKLNVVSRTQAVIEVTKLNYNSILANASLAGARRREKDAPVEVCDALPHGRCVAGAP